MALPFWAEASGVVLSDDEIVGLDDFSKRIKIPAATQVKGITGDIYSSREHEIIFLDGTPFPGINDVKGIAELRVDNKKAPGSDGSTVTITGYQPGPFEIVCKTWTPDQWETLQAIVDLYWNVPRRPTPKDRKGSNVRSRINKALTVYHPKLAELEINYCIIQGVGLLEDGPEPGTRIQRFKCREWRPSTKNKTKTPKAPGPGRVVEYQSGNEPKVGAPPAPSSNPKNLRPGGPPARPASGAH